MDAPTFNVFFAWIHGVGFTPQHVTLPQLKDKMGIFEFMG